MKFKFFVLIFFLTLILILPWMAQARIGVGVGSGKIEVTEKLQPGGIYELPSLPVLNTGDEKIKYGVSLEYHENQTQFKPPREWFDFQPREFYLEPSKIENVKIILTVPLKTIPGDYFAYLEAHPLVVAESGVTNIGIAAAAKLYFTVAPTNFFQAVYYRVIFFFKHYAPWTWIILILIVLIILIIFARKKLNFQFNISKK